MGTRARELLGLASDRAGARFVVQRLSPDGVGIFTTTGALPAMRAGPLIFAVLVGCGPTVMPGDAGDAGAPRDTYVVPDAGVSIDDACARVMRARFRVFADCDDWTDPRFADAIASAAACSDLDALRASIARGDVTLDQQAFFACEAGWVGATCGDDRGLLLPWLDSVHATIAPVLASCGALVGRRAAGATCDADYECVDTAFCGARPVCGTGTCERRAARGEDCLGRACLAGLWCQPMAGAYRCVPPLDASTPCDSSRNACDDGTFASFGWYCDPTTSLCRPPRMLGETCGSAAPVPEARCELDLVCGGDAPPARCSEPPGLGGTCADVLGIWCERGLMCDGDAFDPATGRLTALGTCAELRDVGGACEVASDCRDGMRCPAGVCAMRAALGEACSPRPFTGVPDLVHHPDCAEGLWCEGGRCAHQRLPGERCDDGMSHCFASSCVAGTCVSRGGALGTACDDDSVCASGICGDGACAEPSCP